MDLIYSLESLGTFKKSKAFNQMDFWKHSLAVAFIFRSLTRKFLSDSEEWEVIFLAGLMLDCSILVFDNIIPEEYYKFLIFTLKDLSSTDHPFKDLEKDDFKVDHSEIGAKFMEKWWAISDKVNSSALTNHERPLPTKDKTVGF